MILEFVVIAFIVFIINYLINYVHMKKNDALISNKALLFIQKKYKLKLDDKKIDALSKIIIIDNTLIISIAIELILRWNINYFVLAFVSFVLFIVLIIISFILFIILILISYNLLGYILKKKGW